MKRKILLIVCIAISIYVQAQTEQDKHGVEKAVLNYVEAFYEADTAKAYESIVPFLAKRGYYADKTGAVKEATMSFDQLIALAKRWKHNQNITSETPKKITVFEVSDKIATAKLVAKWGIDYFHLAKLNGKWMIVNVLWQDPPKN